MLSDRLRSDEVALTERTMEVLSPIDWARPVVRRLRDAGGITPENKPRMFEVRVAYELHLAGLVAEYEHRTGEGDMSIDFYVPGEPPWRSWPVCASVISPSIEAAAMNARVSASTGPFVLAACTDRASVVRTSSTLSVARACVMAKRTRITPGPGASTSVQPLPSRRHTARYRLPARRSRSRSGTGSSDLAPLRHRVTGSKRTLSYASQRAAGSR
jgi:hypothetical protein